MQEYLVNVFEGALTHGNMGWLSRELSLGLSEVR